MFAQNGEISSRQLYRLYVFNLLGVGTLVLPSNLAELGKYGFLAIVFGSVLAWIFMRMVAAAGERHSGLLALDGYCHMDSNYGEDNHAKDNHIDVRKKIILWIAIALYQLLQAAFLAWVFVKLIRDSLIPDESFAIVLLVIMCVCAYALSGGVECRARVYEVVFWFVIIPLIAMLLFAVRDINVDYIKIKDRFNLKTLLLGTYYVFASATSLVNILHIKGKNQMQIRKNVGASIATFAAIMLLLYGVLLGNFGKYALAEIDFPAVVLMSDVQIKGSFFKRADALMLAVWFFTLFSVLNMSMYYAAKMCENIRNVICNKMRFNNKNYIRIRQKDEVGAKACNNTRDNCNISGWCIALVTILTAAGTFIMQYGEYGDGMVKRYLGFLLWIGIPVMVIIVIALMCTGCSSVELEDRCFPTLAAVNLVPDDSENSNRQIEFYYNMEKSYEPEYAATIEEAVEKFEDKLPQKADTNHMKVMLIGKELYDDKEAYKELIEYCRQSRKIPRNTYVCVVDDIDNIFDNMGQFYEQKLDKQERDNDLEIVTLGTLLDDYTNFGI